MAAADHSVGTQHHHCEEMQEQAGQTDETEADASLSSMHSSNSPQKCPMNCCGCGTANVSQEAALIPAAAPSSGAVAGGRVFVQDIVFSNNGFSSHTDRGPPSSEL